LYSKTCWKRYLRLSLLCLKGQHWIKLFFHQLLSLEFLIEQKVVQPWDSYGTKCYCFPTYIIKLYLNVVKCHTFLLIFQKKMRWWRVKRPW
jgi:hypothetical protein